MEIAMLFKKQKPQQEPGLGNGEGKTELEAKPGQILRREASVLEEAEQREIVDQAEDEPQFPPLAEVRPPSGANSKPALRPSRYLPPGKSEAPCAGSPARWAYQ
jgi:hypothetical protein